MPLVLQAVCVNMLRALDNRTLDGQRYRVFLLHHKLESGAYYLHIRHALLQLFHQLKLSSPVWRSTRSSKLLGEA